MADTTVYASADDLAQDTILTEEFETLTGRKVLLRGLSRTDVLRLRKLDGDSDAHTLVKGVTAPALTLEQAKTWMDNSPAGETDEVAGRILALSGLGPDAGKDAYKSVRGESRA